MIAVRITQMLKKKKDKDLAGDMAQKDKELRNKEREGSKGRHKDGKEP